MILGTVTADHEAVVRLDLRGTNGIDANIEAVIDTGFTEFLSLPETWVTALALPFLRTNSLFLADETEIVVDLYECIIVWNGQERSVEAHCMKGNPLIGMSLLHTHLLTMLVEENGPITIAPHP